MAFDTGIKIRFDRPVGNFILGDPRMTIVRSSAGGTGVNRLGRIFNVPANTIRPRFHPVNGMCEGAFSERAATNLALRSEEADNAAWTKTNLTATANSTTSPDGNVTADTLAATGASGNIAQAITITAGRGIFISAFGKANASGWMWIQVTDGTNTVECWYNLASGVTGTNTAGAATCTFVDKFIEPAAFGFQRCMLVVNTATSTAFTIKYGPAASDGAQPANTNSIYWWGAMAAADATQEAPTSYIPTAGSTVTRNAEALQMPLATDWFNPNEGTIILDVVNRQVPTLNSTQVFGGVANTFNDVIYVSRIGGTTVRANFGVGGVSIASLDKTGWTFTAGTRVKFAIAWAANDMAFVVDGAAALTSAAAFTPPTFARFGIGCAPWTTTPGNTVPGATVAGFEYVPRRITNAEMQSKTAA